MKKVPDIKKNPYVSTYLPISGHKSVLLTWDEDCNCHTPWNTGMWAHCTADAALEDALDWAYAENIPVSIDGVIIDLELNPTSLRVAREFIATT